MHCPPDQILRDYIEKKQMDYDSFCWWNDQCLDNIPLEGKNILDVGCGDGTRSAYITTKYRPAELLGIDSYGGQGSATESGEMFNDLIRRLGLSNLKALTADFRQFSPDKQVYDVILCLQVIHHLISSEHSFLQDSKLFNDAVELFRKLHSLLKSGGCLVLEEVSSNSVFKHVPIRYRQINWKTKRPCRQWISVLNKAGFSTINVKRYVPYKLRKARALLENSFANFCLGSKYFIYAYK